jgi:HEAT repeat protein
MGKRLFVLVFALATAGSAGAQAPKPSPKPEKAQRAPKPPALSKADSDRLKKALESNTESEVLAALSEIRGLGQSGLPLAPFVEALLARGSSAAVVVQSCETAGALGSPASSTPLAPYVQHRHPEIRHAAARALIRTKGEPANQALRKALGSSDAQLRAIAAQGLGELGVKAAVEDLFTVLARDTPEAATSIAMLCSPEQCDRFMGLVGKLKFETLEPAFVPLLSRPASAVPEDNQLRYVDRLRRLATSAATAVLTTALARLPEDASPRLRRALDAASKGRPAPKE